MNAITRTASVAVLVALGLALTAQAAEPAKPAAPVDLDKLVGQPVLDVKGRPVDAGFKRQCVQAGEPIDKQTNLVWKRIDLLIEWGFKKVTEAQPFDGTIEAIQVGDSPVAMVGKAQPLPGDGATVMTGERAWKSPAASGARRGIVVPILYTAATRGPGRSVVAVRTTSGSFSFMPADLDGGPILRPEVEKGGRFKAMVKVGDLDGGPILAPEYGFFVATVASNTTAAAFEKELAAKGLKTIRQRVREMPEQTWEGAMEALYGKREWPAPPQVPYEPKTKIEVPCKYLTGLWRIGAWQIVKNCLRVKRADIKNLKGKMRMCDLQGLVRTAEAGDPEGILMVPDYPYLPLAQETDRILWALDHMGMHDVSSSVPAAALAAIEGWDGRLPKLAAVDASAAAALATFEGRGLILDGLTTVSVDAAQALARFKGERLDLNGLGTLDIAAAAALAGFEGRELLLDGLTTLDAATIAALAGSGAWACRLPHLSALDPAAARTLVTIEKWDGDLPGLTAFDSVDAVAVAAALATRDGRLALPNLKKISSKTLTALVAKKDVEIPFIETLELISEPDGSATEDFIIPGWLAEREDRQRLGFAK